MKRPQKKRGINPYKISRENLIGMIIAHDAYYEGQEDARRKISTPVKVNLPEKREKYHLEDEYHGENYYLELTDSQANFYRWLDEKSIVFSDAKFEPLGDLDFEAP